MLRALCRLAILVVLIARPASAASDYVQWATPSTDGAINDPAHATMTVPGSFVEADLASDVFKGRAAADGAAQSAIATVAYLGITDLLMTKTTGATVTLGGVFPFDVELDATFAHTAAPPDDGSWTTELTATLWVDAPQGPRREATVAYGSAETWVGGDRIASVFSIEPTEIAGAAAQVIAGTPDALVARLSTGSITLGPGESMTVNLFLRAIAHAGGAGYSATTDMASTPRIRLVVPAGVTLSSDAAVPLGWVTVPEPADRPLLGAGVVGLATLRVARRSTRSRYA